MATGILIVAIRRGQKN